MATTFLQLCQKLRAELAISGTGPAAVTNQTGEYAKIVRWVADAEYDIAALWFDWKFLWKSGGFSQAVTNGDYDYNVPSDLGVWDRNSFCLNKTSPSFQPLTFKPYEEYSQKYGRGTVATGTPSLIFERPDGVLILYPTPNASFTLTADYWKQATKMSANANTSGIPTQFDRVIMARATMLYAKEYESSQIYKEALDEYKDILDKLEAHQLGEQRSRRRSVDTSIVVRVE